jgi:hypothetical protein
MSFNFFLERKHNTIKFSFKKFLKCRSEVKLGFGGKNWNIKDLKLQRGSRVGELKRQSTIELSFKN